LITSNEWNLTTGIKATIVVVKEWFINEKAFQFALPPKS
jgi:hypothetical protein